MRCNSTNRSSIGTSVACVGHHDPERPRLGFELLRLAPEFLVAELRRATLPGTASQVSAQREERRDPVVVRWLGHRQSRRRRGVGRQAIAQPASSARPAGQHPPHRRDARSAAHSSFAICSFASGVGHGPEVVGRPRSPEEPEASRRQRLERARGEPVRRRPLSANASSGCSGAARTPAYNFSCRAGGRTSRRGRHGPGRPGGIWKSRPWSLRAMRSRGHATGGSPRAPPTTTAAAAGETRRRRRTRWHRCPPASRGEHAAVGDGRIRRAMSKGHASMNGWQPCNNNVLGSSASEANAFAHLSVRPKTIAYGRNRVNTFSCSAHRDMWVCGGWRIHRGGTRGCAAPSRCPSPVPRRASTRAATIVTTPRAQPPRSTSPSCHERAQTRGTPNSRQV